MANEQQKESKPWDVFRFLQQSSRFVNIIPQPPPSKRIIEPGDILWKVGDDDGNEFTFAPL